MCCAPNYAPSRLEKIISTVSEQISHYNKMTLTLPILFRENFVRIILQCIRLCDAQKLKYPAGQVQSHRVLLTIIQSL